MKFHRRCGDRVTLLHDNSTAVRNFVEFNHGLILSAEPLPDDVIFEVCIDRKVNVWNGSLEIGVTTQDPEFMDLPATATKLRNTAWIMSGCSVVKDGVTLINEYGPELDSLHEGEVVGVMRSSKGELSFYVNGRCLGVAADKIPSRVFAVIDLYGQCVQVTIIGHNYRRLESSSFESVISSMEALQSLEPLIVDLPIASTSNAPPGDRQQLPLTTPAETANSLEEGEGQAYNNDWQVKRDSRETNSESSGSGDPDQDVMSDRCTDDDSREDRYDSIARGIRDVHLDSNVTGGQNREEVADGTNAVGILYDWHLEQITPYTGDTANSQFDNSLSEVSEAGLTSEESEAIVDEVRPAENRVVETLITMPDDDNDIEEPETVDEFGPAENRVVETLITMPDDVNDIVAHDKLRFHPRCGFLVKISPNYRCAERSRPLDDYNNGVVMTHRPLRDNELFEIRIDKLVDKWSGSIEIILHRQQLARFTAETQEVP